MSGEHDGSNGESPAVGALRDRVLNHLIGFIEDLRRRGVRVPANASIDGARALAAVGLDDKARVRTALRAAVIARESDVDTFDSLFPAFWRAIWGEEDPSPWEQPEMHAPPGTPSSRRDTRDEGSGGPEEMDTADMRTAPPHGADTPGPEGQRGVDDTTAGTDVETATYSPTGPPRPIDDEERDGVIGTEELTVAVQELGMTVAELQGRRWHRDGTERVDARRVMRRSVATGGAVTELPRVSRTRTNTDAVLLVDVSQSVLDTIDRGLLVRVLAEIHAQWGRVRTFFFDTELREVTQSFETSDPEQSLTALQQAEAEWGGGTRIGKAIEEACRTAPPTIDRNTAVFVVSDGLEVGEIDRLERAMAELDRRARLVLWLNPLAADPGYAPTTRGMEAALPYIDGLFAFVGPADLQEVARQLRRRGVGGPLGYEFDPRRIGDPAD